MSDIDTSAEAVERMADLTFNVQTRLKDREQFVMSIPARPDHDMDLILANAAATLRALAAERDAGNAAREAAAAEAMRERKDAAYEERNRVVALLAAMFPAVRCRTAIAGWSDDWHGCVYITLPTGQASWHYHDSHAHLFGHVPEGPAVWDGHTTDEKYRRVADACTPDALSRVRAEAMREGMEAAVAILRARHKGLEHLREYAEAQHAADEIAAAIRAAAQEIK